MAHFARGESGGGQPLVARRIFPAGDERLQPQAFRSLLRDFSRGLKPALPRMNAGAPTVGVHVFSENFYRL